MSNPTDHKANRLIHESSPYLLQHANNPVDWHPWGKEAFQRAASEDKPIFLSIGYSTCHWCHVMERESFMDETAAEALNRVFIPVKVDREERPDIDDVYMRACQMMTGGGGWPLTILMTPDKKPFYADTYIPRTTRYGKPGLLDLIREVERLWRTDREHIHRVAENATRRLKEAPEEGGELNEDALLHCYLQLTQTYDPTHGGFGRQPKFPMPHQLLFLLRYWHRSGEARALEMVEKTLRSIRLGGIYDHIAGGLHRYSTDRGWLVPHFEKMLYDQALAVMAYAEAFQATGDTFYMEAAKHILGYVLSEMRSPEGGFYSALDADSEGEEGKYYLWTRDEITEALGEEATTFLEAYNVREEGNFLDEATRKRNKGNILHMTRSLNELAASTGLEEDRLRESLKKSTEKLRHKRAMRVRPMLDDKILAGWNGLMIAALSKAGRTFNEASYTEAASEAANFIHSTMARPGGGLHRRYRGGEAGINGFAEDYAYTAWGLLELYTSTFDPGHLAKARETLRHLLDYFWDQENGGLYTTGADNEEILVRLKDAADGALPSSNSVAALSLITLARILGEPSWEQKAQQILSCFSAEVEASPSHHTFMLSSLDYLLGPSQEIIIVGDPSAPDTVSMIEAVNKPYSPNKVVAQVTPGGSQPLFQLADYLWHYTLLDGRATAYVCRNQVCDRPTNEADELLASLKRGKIRP